MLCSAIYIPITLCSVVYVSSTEYVRENSVLCNYQLRYPAHGILRVLRPLSRSLILPTVSTSTTNTKLREKEAKPGQGLLPSTQSSGNLNYHASNTVHPSFQVPDLLSVYIVLQTDVGNVHIWTSHQHLNFDLGSATCKGCQTLAAFELYCINDNAFQGGYDSPGPRSRRLRRPRIPRRKGGEEQVRSSQDSGPPVDQ
jgi:hypothetical protein